VFVLEQFLRDQLYKSSKPLCRYLLVRVQSPLVHLIRCIYYFTTYLRRGEDNNSPGKFGKYYSVNPIEDSIQQRTLLSKLNLRNTMERIQYSTHCDIVKVPGLISSAFRQTDFLAPDRRTTNPGINSIGLI